MYKERRGIEEMDQEWRGIEVEGIDQGRWMEGCIKDEEVLKEWIQNAQEQNVQ